MKLNKRFLALLLIVGGIVSLGVAGVLAFGSMFQNSENSHEKRHRDKASPHGYSMSVQPQQAGVYQLLAPQTPQTQPVQTLMAVSYTPNQQDTPMMYDHGSFGGHGRRHGPGPLGILFCLGLPALLGGLAVWFVMNKRQGATPPTSGGNTGNGGNIGNGGSNSDSGNTKTDDSTATAHTTEQYGPEQPPYTGSTQVL